MTDGGVTGVAVAAGAGVSVDMADGLAESR